MLADLFLFYVFIENYKVKITYRSLQVKKNCKYVFHWCDER